MLPNMASSKSSRASIMPSSLSLSTVRPSTASNESESGPRAASTASTSTAKTRARRKSTIGLLPSFSQRHTPSPERQPSPVLKDHGSGEPVPPRLLSRKARTWDRFTSFLPSLTTHDTDPQQTGSVRRKPISPMSPPPPPPSTAAPPPYRLHDPHSPPGIDPRAAPPVPRVPLAPPPKPPTDAVCRDSPSPPLLSTHIPTTSFSAQYLPNPQIMAPTPPSPDMKRATLTKKEPAARAGTQRSSSSTIDSSSQGDSPRQKLQKENHDNRPRRNSIQQPKAGQAHANLQAAVSGPTIEHRGRRVVSSQTPTLPADPRDGTRVASLPVGQPPVTARSNGGRESPSGTRPRRSWLPGGGRSRSNSVEVSKGGPEAYAWVLDDNHAEYNPSFLKNGEKVSCPWAG